VVAAVALCGFLWYGAVPGPRFRAILIAPAHACDSRLEFLHVFERPALTHIRFEGVVVLQGSNDALVTETHIYSRMELPTLLLYDEAFRLRMAIEAPKTVESADMLIAWLAGRDKR
jgi:hypothetical protein